MNELIISTVLSNSPFSALCINLGQGGYIKNFITYSNSIIINRNWRDTHPMRSANIAAGVYIDFREDHTSFYYPCSKEILTFLEVGYYLT